MLLSLLIEHVATSFVLKVFGRPLLNKRITQPAEMRLNPG